MGMLIDDGTSYGGVWGLEGEWGRRLKQRAVFVEFHGAWAACGDASVGYCARFFWD